jgi:hypothetical protein
MPSATGATRCAPSARAITSGQTEPNCLRFIASPNVTPCVPRVINCHADVRASGAWWQDFDGLPWRALQAAETVDHHVSAVLAKLDAPSRNVAAAHAVRLGLTGPAET